jgi:broad specificity phosphatase PhoE
MQNTVRYLSHPQVRIDPDKDIQKWSLNDLGSRRVDALAQSNGLKGTGVVISSAETKAIETAQPLADALNCDLQIRELMHENDRSATGFLPPEEFEMVAEQFFANPEISVRGWETAVAAQQRIYGEVLECLEHHAGHDILFVGHGGVGTLLWCALTRVPISRQFDQGGGGGGCYFEFGSNDRQPMSGWSAMEKLSGYC